VKLVLVLLLAGAAVGLAWWLWWLSSERSREIDDKPFRWADWPLVCACHDQHFDTIASLEAHLGGDDW
jgi:hypothetical protein